jgi:hypothetical protein
MKGAVSAHLRRARDLLQWLDHHGAEARVFFDAEAAGTWQSIHPSWTISPGAIQLRCATPHGFENFHLSSARCRDGACMFRLFSRSGNPARTLMVLPEGAAGDLEDLHEELRFRSALNDWIGQTFPGSSVRWHARRADRQNSLSGSFHRILVSTPAGPKPVLAVPPMEAGESAESALCQLFLWIILLRRSGRLQCPSAACILLPSGLGWAVCHRCRLLPPRGFTVEVLEYTFADDGSLRVQECRITESPVENRDFRWPVLGPFQWNSHLQRVIELAPGLISRYPRFSDYDSLRIFGLEFARAQGETRDRVRFGVGKDKVDLTDENFAQLRRLVDEILFYRRPDSPDKYHPWYRMQGERWLENLLLASVPALFPELLPAAVYSQIPVYLGTDAGRVDILGLDSRGVLTVMELKVAPDPNLPIQAMDYWGRVVQHNSNGDFEKRGYFSGLKLGRLPPRIYLVSPVFAFHRSTENIQAFFDPQAEVWKIGINEDWRSGVKILRRVKLRCDESDAD